MNIEKYKEYLLSSIPTASLASGGKVLHCRCFECPDSSNPKSKHFYISIPQTVDEPSLYYCHKCHCSGIVSYNKLIEWNIYNEDVAIELTNHNKLCSTKTVNSKYFNRIIYNINNNFITDNNISRIKLDYINQRIGTSFNFDDLRELKIVLNLNDLLNNNGISNITRDQNIVSQLDGNFMGFISIDNAFLNMRRICDEGLVYKSIDKRYINYKIFDKFDTSERFYTIPTKVDLSKPERVKIHIAEGPFDILSIYENLRRREEGIYTSIAGSNYLGIAMYFLSMFKLPFVEFHYYPDNDKFGSNKNMYRINNILKPIQAPYYIHRNMYEGEKDFGVNPDHIREKIIKIN